MKYILNNFYILRHDVKRSFIMSHGEQVRAPEHIAVNLNWRSMIHPAYAMMLSFFSMPITLDDACKKISSFFSVKEDVVNNFIRQLIETKIPMHTSLGGMTSGFPVNILIEERQESFPRVPYTTEQFLFKELDHTTSRMFKAPISIVFMPNNNCYTNCAYCYADTKTRNNTMSFKEIEAFVKDAKDSGVRDILITGGDLFMYPKWEALLMLLKNEGFMPDLISTKKPLSSEEIDKFEELSVRLQVSLDSVIETTVRKVLGVGSSYTGKMKETLLKIDKRKISYQVATVLTNLNDNADELNTLFNFLRQLNNLERWEIRIAFKSLYSRRDFNMIKSSRESILYVEKWIANHKEQFPCEILWSPDDDDKYKKAKGGSQNFEGRLCSANMTNMVVLPDGDVTICEQLYWNPNFIIGNVKNNTIEEIWNSSRALSIWRRSQTEIKQDSPCARCKIFAKCFKASNRCYANIMKAYGSENYDYPDPRCFWAPEFNTDITHGRKE